MKRRIFTFRCAAFYSLVAVLLGAGSIEASASASHLLSSSPSIAHTDFFNLPSKSNNLIRGNSTTNLSEVFEIQQDSARVQLIHNAADSTADTLDVYMNGVMLLDNFAFRTATPFMNVQAGQDMVISFVHKDSADTTGAVFTDTINFGVDSSYIVVASGNISDTGYLPMQPFMLHTMEMARDTSVAADSVDVLFYHGATDAPAFDITAGIGAFPLVDSLSYGMFSDYQRSNTAEDAPLQLMVAGGDSILGTYSFPSNTFALGGNAVTVLASGYMNQESNSNGPAFGLFMADPQGGKLIPLPQSPGDNEARIQLIHVSNDMNADTVDVYVNNMKVVDNLEFAYASPFMNVTEGQNVVVSFNNSNSTDTTGAVFKDTVSFTAGNTYVLVASGSSTDTISPVTRGIQLNMYEPAQEISGTPAMVDVLIYHGATSVPAINVNLGGEAAILAGNISYGEFSGYTSIDTNNVNVDVSAAEGDSLIGSYLLPLQELNAKGRAFTIVAAGAAGDTTSEDSTNANQLSLWVASSEGGQLMQLNSVLASAKKVDNNAYRMTLFPNPSSQGYTNVSYELSRPEEVNFNIYDLKGSLVRKISEGNKVPGQYLLNISTSGLNRGLYLMRMETKTTISTLKLVVE
jgi:hypothetical protein